MLDDQTFETVISSTPLISIDLLVKNNNKILLGKRINKPAQSYFFSIGGRVYKNEAIDNAMMWIAKNELNLPNEQHNEYQWLTIDELLESKQVHKHVKDYFKD